MPDRVVIFGCGPSIRSVKLEPYFDGSWTTVSINHFYKGGFPTEYTCTADVPHTMDYGIKTKWVIPHDKFHRFPTGKFYQIFPVRLVWYSEMLFCPPDFKSSPWTRHTLSSLAIPFAILVLKAKHIHLVGFDHKAHRVHFYDDIRRYMSDVIRKHLEYQRSNVEPDPNSTGRWSQAMVDAVERGVEYWKEECDNREIIMTQDHLSNLPGLEKEGFTDPKDDLLAPLDDVLAGKKVSLDSKTISLSHPLLFDRGPGDDPEQGKTCIVNVEEAGVKV